MNGSEPLTLGVMGGGQLGRMFVHAAQSMGYFTAVLDPDANSPAGLVSHHHIQTAYTDPEGLKQLAACSAAITTEFENVPAPALRELAKHRPVSPGAEAVAIAQDRMAEKRTLESVVSLVPPTRPLNLPINWKPLCCKTCCPAF